MRAHQEGSRRTKPRVPVPCVDRDQRQSVPMQEQAARGYQEVLRASHWRTQAELDYKAHPLLRMSIFFKDSASVDSDHRDHLHEGLL